MAIVADGHRMRSDQRKPVVVLPDLGDLHAPASNGMAILAVGPELPPVQVGMTLGTLRGRLGEVQAGVASDAGDILVPAQQREFCLAVMDEFRLLPDWLPRRRGVAALAL
jgi:hypothetical protein